MASTRKQRPKRRHHYFPTFHLAYFTNEHGFVWVYDKKGRLTPNPKPLKPKDIGLEADLYTLDPEEALPPDELENWLAREVDSPAAPVMRKVTSSTSITVAERADLARYVMSRDLRTPRTRAFVLGDAQRRVDEWYDQRTSNFEQVRAEILAAGGPELADDEIAAFSKEFRPEVLPGFWLDFMVRNTTAGIPRLLTKGWRLVRADADCSFVTSDIGILKHRGHFGNPVPYTPGWWVQAEGWLMPLTPTLQLMMAPGLKAEDALAQQVFVDRVNSDLASQAFEFVFARDVAALQRACQLPGDCR